MTKSLRRSIPMTLSVCLFAAGASVAGHEGKKLDKGLLDPAWFGPNVEFRTTEDIDYIWARPGFSLKGRKLHIEKWSDPEFLGEEREARDSAKASELTEVMPSRLRGALASTLSGIAEVSRDEGDIMVTGRIVDCESGSKAAKMWVGFGAGKAYATWDIKFTDMATGEVLVAVHHRSISGTAYSEIDDKIAKWLEKFGEALRDDLAVVASGKVARK
jgi:hypothetical protein